MSGPAVSHVAARFGGREAVPVASFLDQTLQVDIDGLQAKAEKADGLAHHLRREREKALAVARTLLEPHNLPLLEWLLDITLRRPNFLPLAMSAEAIAIHAAYREGQNAVIWQLMAAIAESRSETLLNREGT